MAANDEFRIIRNLFGIYDTPVIIERFLDFNTAKTIQNNCSEDEINLEFAAVIICMMSDSDSILSTLIPRVLESLKRFSSFQINLLVGNQIYIAGINWNHFFSQIDTALNESYVRLKNAGFLGNIIDVHQNFDFNYHLLLALIFEASLEKSFTRDYLTKNGKDIPIKYFLRDVLTKDQQKEFQSQIPVKEESDYKEEAQKKFFDRLKKTDTYRGKSPGEKYLMSLYSTDQNLNLRGELSDQGILSFIYSRYLVFQNENGNTASYEIIMNDLLEAISFLKKDCI